MPEQDDRLADRLNGEPVIFRGCTSSEMALITGLACGIWLPSALLVTGLMGAVTLGFGVTAIGVVATGIVMASLLQRLKRGRPDGYYQQQIIVWLADRGIRRAPCIRRSGLWSIGRTDDAAVSTGN